MLIDIHHHILPPAFVQDPNVRRAFAGATFDAIGSALDRTLDDSIRMMDEHNVAFAVLSIPTPGVWFGSDAAARTLARQCNTFGAEQAGFRGKRFGWLAALPLPDVRGALDEIHFAFDTLQCDGVTMLTSYQSRWLGDPLFEPVMRELDRRNAVVFVHPTPPAFYDPAGGGPPASVLEFLFDTTRTITSILYHGVARRFPHIKFVFCHAGGALLSLIHRIDRLGRLDPAIAAQLPDGALAGIKAFYFDVATSMPQLNALLDVVPSSQVLLGTDAPVLPAGPTLDAFQRCVLPPDVREAIAWKNAATLFPRALGTLKAG